jgi:hypothetical protein
MLLKQNLVSESDNVSKQMSAIWVIKSCNSVAADVVVENGRYEA